MWSASGEDGSRLASHVRWTWQIGQRSSPAARAARLAAAALWSQRVVPVRDVVMRAPRLALCWLAYLARRGRRRRAGGVGGAGLSPCRGIVTDPSGCAGRVGLAVLGIIITMITGMIRFRSVCRLGGGVPGLGCAAGGSAEG